MIRTRSITSTVAAWCLLTVACSSGTEPGLRVEANRRLFVGEYTACVLDSTGSTSCWGGNTSQLEYGSIMPASNAPVSVSIPPLVVIAGGLAHHSCGITAQREAICWGRGGFGQMGNGSDGSTGNLPAVVAANEHQEWADIRVGRLTTCGVTTAGVAYCWGLNQHGEIGSPGLEAQEHVLAPRMVFGNIEFSSVVPGWIHTCGIARSGAAYCWGDNTSGQLGIGTTDNDAHPEPRLVSFTTAFKKLSLSARSTCGLTSDDRILCWGYNGTGQLGDGTTTMRTTPTPIVSDLKFIDVAVGSGFAGGLATSMVTPSVLQGGVAHACAIAVGGQGYCWGWNGAGQVGDGTTSDRLIPTAIASDAQLTSISLGGAFSCGSAPAALMCWGSNAAGQLGIGTNDDSAFPVPVHYSSWP